MKRIDITKNILNEIKNKNIKPKSKMFYTFINVFKITILSLVGILGGLTFFLIYAFYKGYDYNIFYIVNLTDIFARFIPIKLFIFFIILFSLYFYLFRKIGEGYKISYIGVFGLTFLSFLGIGVLLHSIGIEENLQKYRYYQQIIVNERYYGIRNSLQKEDNGLYTGNIISLNLDKNILEIKDIYNNFWLVDIKHVKKDILLKLEKGNVIKINCSTINNNVLDASHIKILKIDITQLQNKKEKEED